MAVTVTCDLCGDNATGTTVKVEVRNGEHPHCGSTMHKDIDVCMQCIRRIKLYSNQEYDDLKLMR